MSVYAKQFAMITVYHLFPDSYNILQIIPDYRRRMPLEKVITLNNHKYIKEFLVYQTKFTYFFKG